MQTAVMMQAGASRSPAAQLALLQQEHGALLRYLGRLQQRLGTEMGRLQAENLRLHAGALVSRTAWLWGLMPPQADEGPRRAAGHAGRVQGSHAGEVAQVLCQVACEGHAHHWLDEQGQCRRSGETCERLAGAGLPLR